MASRSGEEAQTDLERTYRERTRHSQRLYERALQNLPGGDTRSQLYYPPYPIFIEKGSGCYIHDADGNRYLDVINNYTSLIHGHAYPPVVRAVAEQMAKGSAFGAPTEAQIALASVICKRVPSVEQVRFCNSGTEAVLNAIRVARGFTGRSKILKMEGGYHGTYDAMMVSVHPAPPLLPWPEGSIDEPGLSPGLTSEVVVVPFNDIDTFTEVFERHCRDLAAVIVEPMLGSAGMVPARADFLRALRDRTHRQGVILIFDEVLTFRLAWGGLQSFYEVQPDLTTLGKIIGGGLPVGAFGGRSDIMALFDPRREGCIQHYGTYNGNPLTMAAGLATLEPLTAQAIERLNGLGDRLRSGLDAALRELAIVGQVTGLGSLAHVHFAEGPVEDYRSGGSRRDRFWPVLHLALLNRGIMVAPRGMFALSTTMGEAEVDEVIGAFRGALNDVKPALLENVSVARRR